MNASRHLTSAAPLLGAVVCAIALLGCNAGDLSGMEFVNGKGKPGAEGAGGAVDPAAAANPTYGCSERAKKYVGFGKTDLVSARLDAVEGIDRQRVKPYSALVGEYTRVTGVTAPALLGQSGSTFGQPVARWNEEPEGSAVNLYTAFRIGFETCLVYTQTDAKYAAAPADATATSECRAMARRFWSRTATPEESAACVQMATVESAKETDPRRRWAYACASVLTAAGFLTY